VYVADLNAFDPSEALDEHARFHFEHSYSRRNIRAVWLRNLSQRVCSCTPLQTNLAGNGEALNVVTPAQVPPSAHNTVNGIIWQVMDVATGAVEYKTGCVVVAVD
jgi:hypothetical protein